MTNTLLAISHPTRRAIVEQLKEGPARFLDIARRFDTALNAVTKHLKILERAGLIERTKIGREVFISLRGAPLEDVAIWTLTYKSYWEQQLDTFAESFIESEVKK